MILEGYIIWDLAVILHIKELNINEPTWSEAKWYHSGLNLNRVKKTTFKNVWINFNFRYLLDWRSIYNDQKHLDTVFQCKRYRFVNQTSCAEKWLFGEKRSSSWLFLFVLKIYQWRVIKKKENWSKRLDSNHSVQSEPP